MKGSQIQMKTRKTVSKKTLGREILEWCCTILAAGLIAFPLKAFAFELVRVDGSSMDDTLANGEIMLHGFPCRGMIPKPRQPRRT